MMTNNYWITDTNADYFQNNKRIIMKEYRQLNNNQTQQDLQITVNMYRLNFTAAINSNS